MAFRDTRGAKGGEPSFNESSAHPLLPVDPGNGEVMDQPAPPIMADKDRADDPPILFGDETEPRVACEKGQDRGLFVSSAQPDTFCSFP